MKTASRIAKDIDRRSFLAAAGKSLGLMAASSAVVGGLFENGRAAAKRVERRFEIIP